MSTLVEKWGIHSVMPGNYETYGDWIIQIASEHLAIRTRIEAVTRSLLNANIAPIHPHNIFNEVMKFGKWRKILFCSSIFDIFCNNTHKNKLKR